MFELKIVITVVVTLLLLATFLGTNDVVSGFFGSVSEKFSFSESRDVQFTLTVDNYSDFSFTAKNMVNITVDGYTTATLKTGNLQTNKTLSVYGFRGTGDIAGGTLALNGKISKVELPEITVGVQETITSSSAFTSLSASNIELGSLTVRARGTLTVRNTTTQFSGDLVLAEPAGTFEINKNGHIFYVSGRASKITIPSSGLVID